MYEEAEYDIAGFSVGVVDADRIIDGRSIAPGDAIIGMRSSGVHSNGFSLVRKVLLEQAGLKLDDEVAELGGTLGSNLLTPTRIYVKSCLALIEKMEVKGFVHVTGGGFYDNIPRILPEGTAAQIEYGSWPVPPIFTLIEEKGAISKKDMFRTFNMGIGMIAIVKNENAVKAIHALEEAGESAFLIGRVTSGSKDVQFGGVSWE